MSKAVYFDTQGRNCSPDQEGCILKATSQVTCLGTNCGNSTGISETDPILRISYSVSPIDPQKIRNLGPMPVLNGPDIDIMVNTVRDYAIDKNLCVRVLGITPDNGPIAGGNDIAIQGSGLNKVLNIYIDGQTCQIKSQDPATLTCTAPPSSSNGKKDVLITYTDDSLLEKILLKSAYTYTAAGVNGPTNTDPKECLWNPLSTPTGSLFLPPPIFNTHKFFPPCTVDNDKEYIKLLSYSYSSTGSVVYDLKGDFYQCTCK